jgi:hypothetical protein
MFLPAGASLWGNTSVPSALSLAESVDSLRIESRATRSRARGDNNKVKTRRFFLVALLAAGTATFLFAALRRRRESPGPVPYARPEGGEREGEFELFIGS